MSYGKLVCLAALSCAALSIRHPTLAHGGTITVYNVKDPPYNAGIGGLNDQTPINTAISDAAAAGGGIVYFPPGTYMTSGSILVKASGITLLGSGTPSIIKPQGGFDAVVFNGTATVCGAPTTLTNFEIDDDRIQDLQILSVQTSGNAICGTVVGRLTVSGILVNNAFAGFRFHDFNTVSIERSRVNNPRGAYGLYLTGGGNFENPPPPVGTGNDPFYRSDVIDIKDFGCGSFTSRSTGAIPIT